MATRRKKASGTQSPPAARPRSASTRSGKDTRSGARVRQRESVPLSARGKKGSE